MEDDALRRGDDFQGKKEMVLGSRVVGLKYSKVGGDLEVRLNSPA